MKYYLKKFFRIGAIVTAITLVSGPLGIYRDGIEPLIGTIFKPDDNSISRESIPCQGVRLQFSDNLTSLNHLTAPFLLAIKQIKALPNTNPCYNLKFIADFGVLNKFGNMKTGTLDLTAILSDTGRNIVLHSHTTKVSGGGLNDKAANKNLFQKALIALSTPSNEWSTSNENQ